MTAGLLFSVMQGAGFVARIGWGWVSDRWLSARSLLAGLGVGTIASTVAAHGVLRRMAARGPRRGQRRPRD